MSDQHRETVASVIARLGQPPPDISALWIEDARSHCDAREIPPFDGEESFWQKMVVDERGRAVLQPKDLHSETIPTTPAAVAIDPQRIDFDRDRSRVVAARKRRLPRIVVAAGIIAAMGLLAVLYFPRSSPPAEDNMQVFAKVEPSTQSARRNDPFSPELIDNPEALTNPVPRHQETSSASELDTVMKSLEPQAPVAPSFVTTSEAAEVSDPEVLPVNLTLDALLPFPMAETGAESSPDAEASSIAAIDITEMRDDDEMLTDAIPQPTAATAPPQKQTTAVNLPGPPANSDTDLPPAFVVLAVASPPSNLRLDFPAETELRLQSEGNAWNVIAGTPAIPIAVFEINPDVDEFVALQFRWLAAAADTALSQSLVHGRITTDNGDVVYLRPQLDAQVIVTDLSERDERLQWMLGGPILNTATRLQLTLTVPEDVSVQWVETLNENTPQRTRGIAILTLKETPDSGSLAARIDVRTSATLTMRIRYGARLGPGMPWQWTDAKSIRSSLDATTRQLQIADEQLLHLETAISRAKKLRARQQEVALEIQRDHIEEAVRGGTLIAKRLAELDQLVALLDAEGTITMHLQVQWPGGETQTLLSADGK